MKILGTGLFGLVGSRIVELLKGQYEFDSSEVDITDRDAIIEKIKSSDASIVLHLAAKTDVDGCEKDKPLVENGDAWKINVDGTRNIADACQESNKKLIYISTDFVFDGENPPAHSGLSPSCRSGSDEHSGSMRSKTGGYTEDDIPNPINWYAQTKYEGEKIVQNSSTPWIIARISYPYRSSFERLDFARAILKKLQNNEKVAGVTDHIFTPTFVDDIAFAIDRLIEKKSIGIFHVVGDHSLCPFDAALTIARAFGLNKDLIVKTTRGEFFKNRASRPFHLALKSDKIKRLGIKMRGFEEGIRQVKRQLEN